MLCGPTEVTVLDAPTNQTCGEYLADYLKTAPGYLLNSEALGRCEYCPLTDADQFLAGYGVSYKERWRNSAILWGFVAFNVSITAMPLFCGDVVAAKEICMID